MKSSLWLIREKKAVPIEPPNGMVIVNTIRIITRLSKMVRQRSRLQIIAQGNPTHFRDLMQDPSHTTRLHNN